MSNRSTGCIWGNNVWRKVDSLTPRPSSPPLFGSRDSRGDPRMDIITRRTEAYINFRGMVSSRTRQYETLRSNMAWGGDEAWRHIRPVHRSSWILSRPPADRKLWDSDFDPDVPIRVYIYIYIYISRSLRFGSMNASWNAADFPSLSCPARSLPRSLPLSPGGWRQMLRFIEFRGTQSNYEAVYRDKPVSKERRDLEIEVRKIDSKILEKTSFY